MAINGYTLSEIGDELIIDSNIPILFLKEIDIYYGQGIGENNI